MASTYSNLKIQLMGTGENSGTWGTVTNVNLGTALEEAIVGSADVTFSSADVTLTWTDSNGSQTARNLRLNLTGTVSAAQNLIVPAIEKVYLVNNTLSYAITVKNSSGTGIAVPAGKTMWVYNNGTNVVDATTHLTSLTLGTPLATTQGGTGTNSTTYCNLQSNVSGTLPVANGGTGVTSSTGTGSVVLSASPTFTGTPAAPTAASGTNTTQLATTAFVTTALQAAYPVGSIYMNAVNSTNPGTLLGFGTWTAFGAGRMPVGFNGSDPLFDTAEETGGSKDAIVVTHTHTATSTSSVTDPGHDHVFYGGNAGGSPGTYYQASSGQSGPGYTYAGNGSIETSTTGVTVATTTTVDSTGSSGANANLPPYITVYMWKRTA